MMNLEFQLPNANVPCTCKISASQAGIENINHSEWLCSPHSIINVVIHILKHYKLILQGPRRKSHSRKYVFNPIASGRCISGSQEVFGVFKYCSRITTGYFQIPPTPPLPHPVSVLSTHTSHPPTPLPASALLPLDILTNLLKNSTTNEKSSNMGGSVPKIKKSTIQKVDYFEIRGGGRGARAHSTF